MKFRFSLKLVLMELKVKKGQKTLVNSTSKKPLLGFVSKLDVQ